MRDDGGRKDTLRGYGPPSPAPDDPPDDAIPEGAPTERDFVPPVVAVATPPRKQGTHDRVPLVEIEIVHEHGPAPQMERPWRTVEVWTRNRIYTMGASMVCIDVRDRATRKSVADHPFLGKRLVGGQHREDDVIELSHPFPRPGTEAVFESGGGRHGGFSRTSTVDRVVLRLHVITVAPTSVVPTWEEIHDVITGKREE